MRKASCFVLLMLGFSLLQAQQNFRIILSADSTTIVGIQEAKTNTSIQFSQPLPLLTATINRVPQVGSWKIDSLVPDPISGWIIYVRYNNRGADTVLLENVLPFEPNSKEVYITGKGKHPLSRTHLFLPTRQPVNVIVPDNAWEMGYNSIPFANTT
ncbi:MAG: sulfatase-modifying factor protein, partial [Sediminibacterium sp.]|nr:sulfatase-modifying factor protein [Sediminibacterium sp.]